MPFQPPRKLGQSLGPRAKHRFLARLRRVLTFLWGAVSILPSFVAIYPAFKGNIR